MHKTGMYEHAHEYTGFWYIYKHAYECTGLLDFGIYTGGHAQEYTGFWCVCDIDILYTLDSASLLVKLKPRIFQRLPPFE
jgi:hypothetical protein